MKKIIFVATTILTVASSLAQANTIPQNVTASFSAKYPTATAKKWKQSENNFLVTFAADSKRSVAFYSTDGNWIKTETKIKWIKNLPEAVKKSLDQRGFLRYYITNMKKIESPEGNQYLVEVNDGNTYDADRHDALTQYYRLYFDENGDLTEHVKIQ
jgi:hypothetical protein